MSRSRYSDPELARDGDGSRKPKALLRKRETKRWSSLTSTCLTPHAPAPLAVLPPTACSDRTIRAWRGFDTSPGPRRRSAPFPGHPSMSRCLAHAPFRRRSGRPPQWRTGSTWGAGSARASSSSARPSMNVESEVAITVLQRRFLRRHQASARHRKTVESGQGDDADRLTADLTG